MIAYGAMGVGDTKMKVHKAAIAKLFERNDQIFDAEDFGEALTPELREQEARLRAQAAKK